MLEYKEDHLIFVKDFIVPYTINYAENKCLVVKGKKNASSQFVTEKGGSAYAGILSILETSKQNNKNGLEKLEQIFTNQPFFFQCIKLIVAILSVNRY